MQVLLGLLTIGTPRPVMPATKVANNRQSRETSPIDRAGETERWILTSAAATVPTSHWLRLQAPRCPFKKGHRWNTIRSAPHLTLL